jgi:hypothetical protein
MEETLKLVMPWITGGLAGAILTLAGKTISERRQQKRLDYSIRYQRIFPQELQHRPTEFTLHYRGELLPDPVLLAMEIKNPSSKAVENPPLEIRARGATYVIPGWFEDVPDGYESLWDIERVDAEACAIHVKHINPGQTLRAFFLLDEYPSEQPVLVCPMADLRLNCLTPELKGSEIPSWG